jgi:enoyl-CoA hydratase/carnithine racemase|tara:strand:- start:125 stop:595 length:471 start_codon:yes stop_codon:yes gene_type:complete
MVLASPPQFETLRLSWLDEEGHVLLVDLNRPRKRNAINSTMWSELRECFATLQSLDTLRVVLLAGGESASFCGGIDISEFGSGRDQGADTARSGLRIRRKVIEMQQAFGAMEALSVPVVACVHGACVGAGVDMITACDVRWASADAFFCVKEVDSS